jgi:hypothetical protein
LFTPTEEPTMTPTKTEITRQLQGTQTADALRPVRSAVLIAKHNAQSYDDPNVTRVWIVKADYPTLDAAADALRAAGLPAGLDFTQYGRGNYDFQSFADLLASAKPGKAAKANAPITARAKRHAAAPAASKAAKPTGDGERWPLGTKRCPRCEQTKPRAGFASNAAARDGAFSICKECEHIDRKRRAEAKKAAEATPEAPGAKPKAARKSSPKATPRGGKRKPKA